MVKARLVVLACVALWCMGSVQGVRFLHQADTPPLGSAISLPQGDPTQPMPIGEQDNDANNGTAMGSPMNTTDAGVQYNDFAYTVFLPNTEAIVRALTALNMSPDAFLNDTQRLSDVLSYYISPSVIKAANITSQPPGTDIPIPTLQGTNLTGRMDENGSVAIIGSAGNTANVIQTNIAAGQYIVHVIDAVLMPPGIEIGNGNVTIGQDNGQSAAGGVVMQPPEDPTADGAAQQPPEDPAAGGVTQQPPEDPTAGGVAQQPPEDPTAGGAGQQPPEDPTADGVAQQPPEDLAAGGATQQPPEDPAAGGVAQQPPEDPAAGGVAQQPPEDPAAGGVGA